VDLSHEAVLNSELREFTTRFRLSEREQEVLCLLVQGYTSSESISRMLEISPNTTNNHVKAILDKTGTSSKTELLAAFLKSLLLSYTSYRLLMKKPRVLLIGNAAEQNAALGEKLRLLGIEVFAEPAASDVVALQPKLKFDFVLGDAADAAVAGGRLAASLNQGYARDPVLFVLCDGGELRRTAAATGAAAAFSKPLDFSMLYFRMLEHFIESAYDRSRLLRTRVSLAVVVNDAHQLKIGNLSYGGAFIPIERDGQWKGLKVNVGDEIDLSIQLDEMSRPIPGRGKVVWKRAKGRVGQPSGFGVRFTSISDDDKETVQAFVRSVKVRQLLPLPV
jgi:DNA-binding NarL/FixJ family response regulator